MGKKHHAITFSAGTGFGITGIFAWLANTAEACTELLEFVGILEIVEFIGFLK